MLKVFDVVCVKCGKETIDFLFEANEDMPKCEECGGDLEKTFGNMKISYKLLYDPRKDKCGWAYDGYATSQYWRACNEAKDRGEKVMPITEITGESSVFKKD